MLYTLLRPLLFKLPPETAHQVTFSVIEKVKKLGLLADHPVDCRPLHVMGLNFPNPIGLAAGLDKNGEYLDALATLGFGFIEIGTVTPRPQPGNPKPRLFRIPQANAIINRLGFNNHGVDKLITNVANSNYQGILGINIGKNFDTPLIQATNDYLTCLRKVYPLASYVTINISSPNTANLRQLQNADELDRLLQRLKSEQTRLADKHGKYTPLAIKIAPDLQPCQINEITALLVKHRIDCVIATNTTLSREGVAEFIHAKQAGGLSGAPLTQRADAIIRHLHTRLQGRIPIIGVGGIMSAADAKNKMTAGASLVQIYTGLIYHGPGLVQRIAKTICTR